MNIRAAKAAPWPGVALGLLVSPIVPAAQPALPPAVEPGQVERQLQLPPQPQPPPARPRVTTPALSDQAPPDAEQIRIQVTRIDLGGPAHFFNDLPLPETSSLNGKEVPLTDIYGMARKLTTYYRNAGYILTSVRVPPQTIAGGVVKLEILEGYLSDVILQGARVRPGLFAAARRALLAERPLRGESLERFLLLFNDIPGMTARGILRAAPADPGASELIVQVYQPRVALQFDGSNRGSTYQGPNQFRVSASLNSALGLSESTTLRYLQAQSKKELSLLSLSHAIRLTASGLDLNLMASRSDGAPDLQAALGGFPLETASTQVRAELGIPLVRTRTGNLRSRVAVSLHDGESEIGGERLSSDRISAARLGIAWDAADRRAGVNVLDLELSKGLPIFGASRPGAPDASRPGGDPRFWKANLYAARLQSLSRGFSVLLAASSQYAFENLLSPEEFAVGGEQFGRAYDPSELVGDSGWAAKLELRHTARFRTSVDYTFYAFGDRGSVHRRLAPSESGGPKRDSAASLGGGVRFTLQGWLTGYVEGAAPVDKEVTAKGNRKTRVFGGLQMAYEF